MIWTVRYQANIPSGAQVACTKCKSAKQFIFPKKSDVLDATVGLNSGMHCRRSGSTRVHPRQRPKMSTFTPVSMFTWSFLVFPPRFYLSSGVVNIINNYRAWHLSSLFSLFFWYPFPEPSYCGFIGMITVFSAFWHFWFLKVFPSID